MSGDWPVCAWMCARLCLVKVFFVEMFVNVVFVFWQLFVQRSEFNSGYVMALY